MFGIFARTFHTATLTTPPQIEERPYRAPRLWDAPHQWVDSDKRPTDAQSKA